MARFIGRVWGGRGEVSRLGSRVSGIQSKVAGWDVGVRVSGGACGAGDAFHVFATGGSTGRCLEFPVAVIHLDESGAVVSSTPAEYDAILEHRAAEERARQVADALAAAAWSGEVEL